MCCLCSNFKDVVSEARELALDTVRFAAFERAKTEMEIMLRTLEDSSCHSAHKILVDIVNEFTSKVEKHCLNE